jgi:hypothetical protein
MQVEVCISGSGKTGFGYASAADSGNIAWSKGVTIAAVRVQVWNGRSEWVDQEWIRVNGEWYSGLQGDSPWFSCGWGRST